MKKLYAAKCLPLVAAALLLFTIASCKKDKKMVAQVIPDATPTQLGLYEADSSIFRELDIVVSKIGTQTTDYGLVFDTGSGGMIIDADGIVPSSMVSSSGFTFAGDSTTINGVTITNRTTMIEYGADDSTLTKVYGNLAYAPVTIGDENGNITIKRLPFLLYYKAIDAEGNKLDAHYFDTFGVSSEYITLDNSSNFITSPFSYFAPGTGLTRGFKLAQLNLSQFSYDGTYVPGLITLGLTKADLSLASGFVMNQLPFESGIGYDPVIPSTVTYNNKQVSTEVLFDTGTNGYSYIEDKTARQQLAVLNTGSAVALSTNTAFNYSYTVTDALNNTLIENPNQSGAEFSIFAIDFFLNNEYLIDYTNNQLGLKNN